MEIWNSRIMVFQRKYTPEEAEQRKKESRRKYVEANREKIRQHSREFYHKNKDRVIEQKRAISRRWYYENREYAIKSGIERRERKKANQEREQKGQEPLPAPPRKKRDLDNPRLSRSHLRKARSEEPSFTCNQGSFVVDFN